MLGSKGEHLRDAEPAERKQGDYRQIDRVGRPERTSVIVGRGMTGREIQARSAPRSKFSLTPRCLPTILSGSQSGDWERRTALPETMPFDMRSSPMLILARSGVPGNPDYEN